MDEGPVFGDRYRILWRSNKPGCVGEVYNYTLDRKGYRIVPLLLDDSMIKKINMRFLATSWSNRGPEIVVSKGFMALPLTFREAGIWHEIGHIHHEHHFNVAFKDQNQVRLARIAAIDNDQVIAHEAEADDFAVGRVGKEAVIGFLTHLLRTRPTDGKLGWNNAGRRELEIRIARIQNL
jgi:hypothetical protein